MNKTSKYKFNQAMRMYNRAKFLLDGALMSYLDELGFDYDIKCDFHVDFANGGEIVVSYKNVVKKYSPNGSIGVMYDEDLEFLFTLTKEQIIDTFNIQKKD